MIELKLDTNALSSLIDKDPQFKLSIQQAVLQNISNRYVKSTCANINGQLLKAAESARKDVQDQYMERESQYTSFYKLKPAAKKQIQEACQRDINSVMADLVCTTKERSEKVIKEAFNSYDKEKLNGLIDSMLNAHINAYVKTKIEERFKEAMSHFNA